MHCGMRRNLLGWCVMVLEAGLVIKAERMTGGTGGPKWQCSANCHRFYCVSFPLPTGKMAVCFLLNACVSSVVTSRVFVVFEIFM